MDILNILEFEKVEISRKKFIFVIFVVNYFSSYWWLLFLTVLSTS